MQKFTSSLFIFSIVLHFHSHSQLSKTLTTVEITGEKPEIQHSSKNRDFQIIEGKKNETIYLDHTSANKVTNNIRQIMAKVPGVNIWETDGSGIQTNFSTRGLSPNRNWEMNMRQNGYDIAADIFGYPEAYYNPPMEAIERIEIIRGAASLQYGPQFGGLVNYILKRNKTEQPFKFENQLSVGSYGMINNYSSIYGSKKKWSYQLYNQLRKGDGWRKNGYYDIRNSHGFLQYAIDESSKISAEYTNTSYKSQQPGGLTDIQYEQNAQTSNRSRNWFYLNWHIANMKYEKKFSENYQIQLSATMLWGERSSIGFLSNANIMDTLTAQTGAYNNRQLDRDYYRNIGLECRNMIHYHTGKNKHDLAFGLRAYSAHTDRNQKGQGSSQSDMDFTDLKGIYPTALDFNTKNIALFAENTFRFQKLSISPGIRYEWIQSNMIGRMNLIGNTEVPAPQTEKERSVLLLGLSTQYNFSKRSNIYGSIAQVYRPILFSELLPPTTTDIIDPQLKDNNGLTIDLGYRGGIGDDLKFDFSCFYIISDNKIGNVRMFPNNDPSTASYIFRTNLGQSINRGIEAYLEMDFSRFLKKDKGFGTLEAFISGSYIQAEYQDYKTYNVTGNTPNQIIVETNLAGKKLEYVPTWMINYGISYRYNQIGIQVQNRYVSSIYTDALNTELPNAAATIGKLNDYFVMDVSAEYKINKTYHLGFGINNFTNQKYSTRRTGGYPGPGIIPADGLTWYASFGIKL